MRRGLSRLRRSQEHKPSPRKLTPAISGKIRRLNDLVAFYYDKADYNQAIKVAKELRNLLKNYIGTNDLNYAACLSTMAILYLEIGDAQTAKDLHQAALQIRRTLLGDTHPDVALSLRNLAMVYSELHQYNTARERIDEALAIYGATPVRDEPEYATCLTILASIDFEMGQYEEAERLHQAARQIRQTALGANHPHYGLTLGNLAELHRMKGDFIGAERLYQEACNIYKMSVGEYHPDYATCLNNLGALYSFLRNYSAALPLLHKASEIWRIVYGEHDLRYALSLNNLADVYHTMGRFTEAEALYLQAIAITQAAKGANHSDLAVSLDNLGLLYLQMGEPDKSAPLFQKALDILRIDPGESHPDFATALNNSGLLQRILGNYSAAEQAYTQSLAIDRKYRGEWHPSVATALNNLASVYIATERYEEGLSLIHEAEAIEDQMIGQVFSLGSEEQRLVYLDAIRRSDQMLMSLVVEHLSSSPYAVQRVYERILKRKGLAAEAIAVQRDALLSGRYAALQPKIAALTTLRVRIAQETLVAPMEGDLGKHQKYLAELDNQRAQLEAELARAIPEINLQQQLRHINHMVVAQKLSDDMALVEFVRIEVLDFKATIANLVRWKPARYIAFVLRTGNPAYISMVDLGEAEVIDQSIKNIRAQITGEVSDEPARNNETAPFSDIYPEGAVVATAMRQTVTQGISRHLKDSATETNQASFLSVGEELRKLIFDPLVSTFAGCKHILLATDGALSWLPFEILPLGRNHYLIDEYQISYISVGRDVLRFGIETGRQPDVPIVVGDPDFDLTSGNPGNLKSDLFFPALAGTQAESKEIAQILNVEPLMQGNVLEKNVKACHSPRVLHLATHGFFMPDPAEELSAHNIALLATEYKSGGRWQAFSRLENPLLRSGLALAGANTWLRGGELPSAAEDGILTAEDVTGIDLLDTALVVLSACETGLGSIHIGEGVFGLRRAFVLAGAKTLVMSLWKVPDQQTQALMVDFYQRMLAGKPRAVALREAQLVLKKAYPEPRFWGAFICQGDPYPLS